MELGAVDFITKPQVDLVQGLEIYSEELIEKVKIAAGARVSPLRETPARMPKVAPKYNADVVISPKIHKRPFKTTEQIIAIGASTGGTEAIKEILQELPPDLPGMVITQHIPAAFSGPFANRMNSITALQVLEAKDGQHILPGHVFIAPGDRHLLVRRDGARYLCELSDGPPVNRHKPSVDVLFRSVAQNVGPNAVGVILTGMGNDGAAGLGEMLAAGAKTVAQNQKSSVVWGMPGEAVRLGTAQEVLDLGKIANYLIESRTH